MFLIYKIVRRINQRSDSLFSKRFTCAGDGEPIDPGELDLSTCLIIILTPQGHHGWLHWFNFPIPDGGRPNTDAWPDVSSYSPSELFPAPGLKTISGQQTFLFSSRNAKTVQRYLSHNIIRCLYLENLNFFLSPSIQRHFHWMAENTVDGAFLQRFAGQVDLEGGGNQGIMRLRDEVGDRVREAAEREGRVFAIM